jgi:hypothetical protein
MAQYQRHFLEVEKKYGAIILRIDIIPPARRGSPAALFCRGGGGCWEDRHASQPEIRQTSSPARISVAVEFCATLKNCTLARLGSGVHHLQEDHPETIAPSPAAWISRIEDGL